VIVVIQHSAQPQTALDRSGPTDVGFIRHLQPVVQPLVLALVMIQLDNPTPIVLSSEKSIIRGIRGVTGHFGFMKLSLEWASPIPVRYRREP
jgi:hypothetical protein